MTLLAIEETSEEAAITVGGSYDQNKWNVTTLIRKRTDTTPKFIGPIAPATARPVESPLANAGNSILDGYKWNDTEDYVFVGDSSTAANTRKVQMYVFNKTTSVWTWNGYITLTLPYRTAAAAVTMRGMKIVRDLYTTGTAAVSGTAVTGTSTAWLTSRLAVGTRIGFGSTDPTAIGTWYQISAIGSDTGITLTASAGTIGDGAYVIEDLRLAFTVTNATPANGSGLFLTKGLRPELFTGGGTTIPAATTVDNIRAVYWLSDAAVTQIHNVPYNCCVMPTRDSWTQHYCYYLDGHSPTDISKFNIRAALTLTAGVDPANAWTFATGIMTIAGTIVATNNGGMWMASHGAGSGLNCMYWCTTTRVYCSKDSSITNGGTSWFDAAMTEVPPGGVNTFALTSAINQVCYDSVIDRFIVSTSGATGFRHYVTQFRGDGSQMDHIWGCNLKQIAQGSADAGITPFHNNLEVALTMISVNGMLYVLTTGTTALNNIMHNIPVGTHWTYAASKSQRLVCPKMSTPNCQKFQRVFVIRDRIIGGDNLGQPPEPITIYYRTTGISDNSGSWTQVTDGNDLTGVSGSSEIQFAIDFRILGAQCVPARIFSVGVVYNDFGNDSHYQSSADKSDKTSKRFAWRFATAFGGTVPKLYVRLYDAVSKTLLLTDDTVTAGYGAWSKSTNDGGAWGSYDTSDKANETTYIRYTPTTLADNIKVIYVVSQT